ncbi:MAG: hypothetical protein HC899_14625 [Leptolyngbyaceae cyanobacterium SM1_4_3]|nr:hypothetical protein [Leptolyngbyaceae cyanobacterium SM1_4_3]
MVAEFLLRYCCYAVRCVVAIATQPTELAKEFRLGVVLGHRIGALYRDVALGH